MKEAKWALSFLGKKKWMLIVSCILTCLATVLITGNVFITSNVADDILKPMFEDSSITTEKILEELTPYFFVAITLVVIRCCCLFIQNMLREKASQIVATQLRNDMYRKLSLQTREFFLNNRSGDLLNKCTSDVDMVGDFVGRILYSFVSSSFMLVFSLAIFFSVSWKFTLCEVALTPIVFATTFFLGKKVRPIFFEARQQLTRLNTVVQENIAGNRVVRAFAREPFEIEKFEKENLKYFEMQVSANKAWVRYSPILETVSNLMSALALILGSFFAIKGEITIGQLLIFTSLSWMLNGPMSQLGFLINDFQRFRVSCERVHEFYDLPASISTPDGAVKDIQLKGEIEFDHVSLVFDQNTVLSDISFHIPAGKTVGLMGPTGSGKSSLFNLLTRFVDVTSGSVKVDGIDVRDFDLDFLRSNIGIALQDVFLFSDTVESNIAFGCPDTSIENVKRASKDADADSFVKRLPDQYDTIVGERGMGLSGGQKQRLALARALAMNSPILVLDDTTSAVDMETEQEIQAHLSERHFNATTLIVAQRISSVKDADVIIILEDGKISEMGSHQELLKKRGYYYHVFCVQQGIPEESEVNA